MQLTFTISQFLHFFIWNIRIFRKKSENNKKIKKYCLIKLLFQFKVWIDHGITLFICHFVWSTRIHINVFFFHFFNIYFTLLFDFSIFSCISFSKNKLLTYFNSEFLFDFVIITHAKLLIFLHIFSILFSIF